VNGIIKLEPASRPPSLDASPQMKSNKRSRVESGLGDGSRKEGDTKPLTAGRQALNIHRSSQVEAEHSGDANSI
jgi:hypothetical protein